MVMATTPLIMREAQRHHLAGLRTAASASPVAVDGLPEWIKTPQGR
jgi:hypothetical protein